MNVLIVSGRLTSNAEVKSSAGGASVLTFSIADNFVYYNSKGEKVTNAEFHKCIKWSQDDPKVADFLIKGKFVVVKGRLASKTWSSEDGVKHESKFVTVEEISF